MQRKFLLTAAAVAYLLVPLTLYADTFEIQKRGGLTIYSRGTPLSRFKVNVIGDITFTDDHGDVAATPGARKQPAPQGEAHPGRPRFQQRPQLVSYDGENTGWQADHARNRAVDPGNTRIGGKSVVGPVVHDDFVSGARP